MNYNSSSKNDFHNIYRSLNYFLNFLKGKNWAHLLILNKLTFAFRSLLKNPKERFSAVELQQILDVFF